MSETKCLKLAPIKRSLSRRLCSFAGAAAALALTCAIVLGGLVIFIQRNVFTVDALRHELIGAIQKKVGSKASVDIGEVRLGGGENNFSAQVLNLVVKGPNGETILSSPDARIDLSPAAIARLDVVPQKITLKDVQLAVKVSADGTIFIGGAPTDAAAPVSIQEVLSNIVAVLNGSIGVGGQVIPSIVLENGHISVDDARNGRQFSFRQVKIASSPSADGRTELSVNAEGSGGPVSIRIGPAENSLTYALKVEQIAAGDLGAIAGVELKFINAVLPVSADIMMQFNEKSQPVLVSGNVMTGAGFILIDDPDATPIALQQSKIRFQYKSTEPAIDLPELKIRAGDLAIDLSGSALSLPGEKWQLNLSGKNGYIEPLTKDDKRLEIASAKMEAVIDHSTRKITFNSIDVAGPLFSVRLRGETVFDEAGKMAMAILLSVGKSDGRAALHLWPSFIAPELRRYLIANFISGTLNTLEVSNSLSVATFQAIKERKPIPAEAVTAKFSVSDGSLRLVNGLPILSGLSFQGQSTGRTASLTSMKASVPLSVNRSLSISEGSFSAADLARKPVEASSQFRMTGPLDAVIELLNQPAMQGVVPFNGGSDGVKGNFDGRISVSLPLMPKLQPKDVNMQAKATLTNVVAEKFIGKEKFEANNLQFSAQTGTVALKGEGKVSGIVANLDIVQPRAGNSEDASITFTLDDAARIKRGINLGSQLTGPVMVTVRSDFPVNTKDGVPVEIDFAKASIDGLLPGWVKPAGKPAKAKFILAEKEAGYRITGLELDSNGPSARGSIEIGADAGIASFQLSSLKLSVGDAMQADGTKTANGMKVNIRANSFDARPFLRGAHKASSAASGKELDLDMKVVALSGFNGEIASGADIKFLTRGSQVRQGNVSVKLNGVPFVAKITPKSDGTAQLAASTGNAGAFLRFMDIYNRVQGGNLEIQASTTGDREEGWVTMHNFILRDEPALKRVAAVATTQGQETTDQTGRQSFISDPSDVQFTKMRVDFSRIGDRFDVSDAVMWGREVGGTLSGQLDYGRDRVNLEGTFVPAFGLNNAFAKIPLFGLFLAGNKNEGVFAVPFQIRGKASAPSLTVNPIAAVSPGFLRKIFDFRGGSTSKIPAE